MWLGNLEPKLTSFTGCQAPPIAFFISHPLSTAATPSPPYSCSPQAGPGLACSPLQLPSDCGPLASEYYLILGIPGAILGRLWGRPHPSLSLCICYGSLSWSKMCLQQAGRCGPQTHTGLTLSLAGRHFPFPNPWCRFWVKPASLPFVLLCRLCPAPTTCPPSPSCHSPSVTRAGQGSVFPGH